MFNILVIGAGVVGQATGKGFAKKGHSVDYVDVDRNRINGLTQQGLMAMEPDQVDWNRYDIIMLTVSTPSVNDRVVLDYIEAAAVNVGRGLANVDKFAVVVVRSTVPPTTTEKVFRPLLEKASGKVAGVDFGLAMNPEFLRQRTNELDFDRPWLTVLGVSDRLTAEILSNIYKPFGSLIVTCTPTEAEMIKYVNNVYNAVKISYFNEVHQMCEQLGIDSKLVGATVARSAESMWNPLYGTRGGIPYGGACLPKDTVGFFAFCQDHGFEHLMLQATIAVNEKLALQVAPIASMEDAEQVVEMPSMPVKQLAYS
ncbi:MAG: nucleotide sugar dehydrogenase [Chloroflexota bacterium]|nr:nucleotide sugar dehydrogenase [Chloroflexota bacterium]